jgi:hypothetical protein
MIPRAHAWSLRRLRRFRLENAMKSLPPPLTFAEGQRYIYGLLAAAAGMSSGASSILLIALLMWGGWSSVRGTPDRHHLRLVARRVHRRDDRRDCRASGRWAGRQVQG